MRLAMAFAALVVAVLSLASSAAPVAAQDGAADRLAAARAYVASPVQQRLIDDMMSADAIIAQFRAAFPQISEDLSRRIAIVTEEEMRAIRPELEAAMTEAAADLFTAEEMTALNAFYASPPGASIALKMQPFMQQSLSRAGPAIGRAQAAIARRVASELR